MSRAVGEPVTAPLAAHRIEREIEDQEVELLVTDTGPGIPRELHEEVFKPFYTTKQASGGRGVGLTISRAMVERHDGTLTVQSPLTARGGTRIAIRLPLHPLKGEPHET